MISELIILETPQDIQDLLQKNRPYFILGKGSNTLLNPECKSTLIAQLSQNFSEINHHKTTLRVPASTPVNILLKYCQENQLSGLEFCAGVPASVGGMIAMNFGCWGKSISDIVTRVHISSEEGASWLDKNTLEFTYRSSIFHRKKWVIMEAEFTCTSSPSDSIKKTVHDIIKDRSSKQPLKAKTFGSIFKNTPENFSAKILEELGYKGKIYNHIQLSDQHANFMVNLGGATFQDAQKYISEIIETVQKKQGILLEPEVQFFTC